MKLHSEHDKNHTYTFSNTIDRRKLFAKNQIIPTFTAGVVVPGISDNQSYHSLELF